MFALVSAILFSMFENKFLLHVKEYLIIIALLVFLSLAQIYRAYPSYRFKIFCQALIFLHLQNLILIQVI
jgi:hypothetical protein